MQVTWPLREPDIGMATDTIGEAKQNFDLVAVFRAAAPETRERKFWVTLVVALLLHATLLIGLIRATPKQIGDPNSAPDAVSVSFVTEAELRDATTGADGGAAAPAQQPTPAPTPPPQPPQPPEQQVQPEPPAQAAEAPPPPPPASKAPAEPAEPAPQKAEQLAKADQAEAPETPLLRDTLPSEAVPDKKAEETKESKDAKETEAKPKDAPKPPQEKPIESPQDLAKERPDLLDLPTTTPTERPQKKQQPKPPQKQAMQAPPHPSMSMPPDAITTPSFDGRSAGVQRPAGITRSGANDDFAKGVIRALRKTMPQMNVLGRVTVKILINMSGNIQSVDVLARSESTDLNRAIVFSTKQASFPFPPAGATEDDRTFTITYIYH